MDMLALLLVIIGALNWGLIGLFNFDLVAALFGGQTSFLSRIVYSLVGLAGLYSITFLMGNRIGGDKSIRRNKTDDRV